MRRKATLVRFSDDDDDYDYDDAQRHRGHLPPHRTTPYTHTPTHQPPLKPKNQKMNPRSEYVTYGMRHRSAMRNPLFPPKKRETVTAEMH